MGINGYINGYGLISLAPIFPKKLRFSDLEDDDFIRRLQELCLATGLAISRWNVVVGLRTPLKSIENYRKRLNISLVGWFIFKQIANYRQL